MVTSFQLRIQIIINFSLSRLAKIMGGPGKSHNIIVGDAAQGVCSLVFWHNIDYEEDTHDSYLHDLDGELKPSDDRQYEISTEAIYPVSIAVVNSTKKLDKEGVRVYKQVYQNHYKESWNGT